MSLGRYCNDTCIALSMKSSKVTGSEVSLVEVSLVVSLTTEIQLRSIITQKS